jgi:hypothetical protein
MRQAMGGYTTRAIEEFQYVGGSSTLYEERNEPAEERDVELYDEEERREEEVD